MTSLGSVALRNVASIEQSARQVRIQRGFFRIASVLAQPLSLTETLDAVAQAACEARRLLCRSPDAGAARAAPRRRTSCRRASSSFLNAGLVGRPRSSTPRSVVIRGAHGARRPRPPTTSLSPRALAACATPRGSDRGAAARRARAPGLVFFAEEQSFTDDEIELAWYWPGPPVEPSSEPSSTSRNEGRAQSRSSSRGPRTLLASESIRTRSRTRSSPRRGSPSPPIRPQSACSKATSS